MNSPLLSNLVSILLPVIVIGIVLLVSIYRKNRLDQPQLPPTNDPFSEPSFTSPVSTNPTSDFSTLKPKTKRSKVPLYLVIAFIVFRFVISIYT